MTNKENKFKEILNNPLLLISVSYPYILVFLVLFGFMYINNLPFIVQNDVPPVINDSLAVVKELPIQEPRITSAVDITTLTKPIPEMLEKGKQLFQTTCSSCHGNEGKGDGPAGAALNPRPRNFHENVGWKNGRTVSALYKTLQEGIAGSGMPSYDYVPAQDRINILSYVRTFMTNPETDSPADISKLDETYKLSKGTELPGTIPVGSAEKIILNNLSSESVRYENIVQTIEGLKVQINSPFAVIRDSRKAVASLLNNTDWKKDAGSFKVFIESYMGRNGFSPSVVSLSKEEFNQLYLSLKSII